MADERLVAQLREIQLFGWFGEDGLRKVADMGQVIHRSRGDVIVRQGEPGDAFYVILSGRAAVRAVDETGTERLLNYLSANEFFGEMALISQKPRMASVQAIEDVELLRFDREVFEELLRMSPEIRSYLVRTRIDFPGKQWDEIAEVYERKHVYGFVESLFIPFVTLIVVLGGAVIIVVLNNDLLGIVGTMAAMAIALLAISVAALYVDWHDDYYIVTSKRVVHSERTLLIRQERREAPIEQVLTVTTAIPNVVARLLGFRDLVIRTASVGEPITFRHLPDAERVQRAIMRMRDKALSRRVAEEKGERLRLLKRRIGLPLDEPASEAGQPPAGPSPPSPGEGRWHKLRDWVTPRMRVETPTSVTWHKHWTVLLAKTALPLLAVLVTLPLPVVILLPGLVPFPEEEWRSWRWGLFLVAIILFLAALGWLFWQYEDWQNDIYVITDTSIIDRESAPFGFREKKRIGSLADIESIYSDVPNLWARLLDYGNVFIDTAGTPKAYIFEAVPDPIAVQQEVFARLTTFRVRQQREESRRRASEFAEWLGDYHQLVSRREQAARPSPITSTEPVVPPHIAQGGES